MEESENSSETNIQNPVETIIEKAEKTDDTIKEKSEKTEENKTFKKPVLLIGPRRGTVGKIRCVEKSVKKIVEETTEKQEDNVDLNVDEPEEELLEKTCPTVSKLSTDSAKDVPLNYKEPSWGGSSLENYRLEVLKSGVILENIDLSERSFHVIGRLPSCHLSLAHPTISRHHAILQFRKTEDEKNGKGLYLYDLGSTHGTFWNGNRIRPNVYVKLHGGHMIRFGCSNRKYILQAPPEDQEEESELSVTELKEKRRIELEERERSQRELESKEETEEKLRKEREENEGIDWGMGEDADEETDLTENPYAAGNDEELFLDDPKKTLRGWFEREGYDLQYHAEEKGVGQFLCWVELPIDTATGRSVRAEALVKGKKKESVIQCALEACRILDRHGLLRQSHHEARKRKTRSWEEQDYYDSDEDNFLDRTGTVEKKREQRMRQAGKLEAKIETYGSLLEKYDAVTKQIQDLEKRLQRNSRKSKNEETKDSTEDALDAFMSNLNSSALSKHDVVKIKSQLQKLRREEENLEKLMNLARPANLPALKPQEIDAPEKSTGKIKSPENPGKFVGQTRKLKIPTIKTIQRESTEKNAENNSCESESDEEKTENSKNKETESISAEKKENRANVSGENFAENSGKLENVEEENAGILTTENVDEGKLENSETEKMSAKRRKRNKRKMDKNSKEMEKFYDENSRAEDYSTWIPPQNQTGDGKTSLNEKYGY